MKILHKEFETARKVNLTFDEFQILVVSYPLFKVAGADGEFDETERQLLLEILGNFFSEIFKDNLSKEDKEKLANLFVDDLKFIDSKKDIFDKKFLEALKEFPLELKTSIKDLLKDMAEVDGEFDDSEKEMVTQITDNYLN